MSVTLKGAAVIVAGRIVDIESVENFETKKPDGVKVLIATGDGHAAVKLNDERIAELQPEFGKPVAWLVRYGANGGRDRDARTYSSFVRLATPNDLGTLQAAIGAGGK